MATGFAGLPQNARTQLSRSALLLAGQLLDQKPAVKSRSILTLRPAELSGRARGTRASHIGRSVGSAAGRVREHTTAAAPPSSLINSRRCSGTDVRFIPRPPA